MPKKSKQPTGADPRPTFERLAKSLGPKIEQVKSIALPDDLDRLLLFRLQFAQKYARRVCALWEEGLIATAIDEAYICGIYIGQLDERFDLGQQYQTNERVRLKAIKEKAPERDTFIKKKFSEIRKTNPKKSDNAIYKSISEQLKKNKHKPLSISQIRRRHLRD